MRQLCERMITLGKTALDSEQWEKCVDQLKTSMAAVHDDLECHIVDEMGPEEDGIGKMEQLYLVYSVDPEAAGMESPKGKENYKLIQDISSVVEAQARTHLEEIVELVAPWLISLPGVQQDNPPSDVPASQEEVPEEEEEEVPEEEDSFTPLLSGESLEFKKAGIAGWAHAWHAYHNES